MTAVLFGGILGSLYSILQFICAPLWGAYSDRVGRRKVLLITIAGLALSYAAWFFAASFWMLVLARVLGGAMGGNLSVATAAVADSTTREKRSSGLAIIGIACRFPGADDHWTFWENLRAGRDAARCRGCSANINSFHTRTCSSSSGRTSISSNPSICSACAGTPRGAATP